MTWQRDQSLSVPGHTHPHTRTLTTPSPPCLWQSPHTNNQHSWLFCHLLFSLGSHFSSLFPWPAPGSDPATFFFLFSILFVFWVMFVIQTGMQVWETWQEQRPRIWQVFPAVLTMDWWWATASLIEKADGADCSQGSCSHINKEEPNLKEGQRETDSWQDNSI